MDHVSRIRKNSLFTLLSQLVRLLTNLILFIGIARSYGVVEFGQFTSAHTLATVFLVLADFGYDVLISSEIARNRSRARELAQTYLSMKLMTAFFATGVMALVAGLQDVSQATRTLMYVFCAYVLVSSLTNFFYALFRGLEEMHHETKISFLMNSLLLATVLLMGVAMVPLVFLAIAFVASRVVGLLLVLAVVNKTLPLREFRFTLARKADFLLMGIFGTYAVFSALYFLQDTILLSIWRGDHDAGIYQSVFKLIAVVCVIQEVVATALLPVLAHLHAEDQLRWARTGNLMYRSLFLLGLMIALVFYVYADQIITLVYGSKGFDEAIPVLRIFGFIVLIRFAGEPFGMMLTTSKRQSIRMAVVVVATVVNYCLNVYLIPSYGTVGAAYSSLITAILVGVGHALPTRPFFREWVFQTRVVVPLIATAAIGGVLWSLRAIPLWYTAPPALAVCGVVAYFVGYSEEERRFMLGRSGDGIDLKRKFRQMF